MTVLGRFACSLLAISAAAPIVGSAGASSAQIPQTPARVVVGDLDFANPRDVELFKRRVDAAAGRLCRTEGQLDFHEMTACYRSVRRRCIRQLDDGQRRTLLAASSAIRVWSGLVE